MRARQISGRLRAAGKQAAGPPVRRLTQLLGGAERTRVILTLACVLALSSADIATVGASATALRSGLGISNTDIGLLVTITGLVAAVATLPFGVLADRVRRTWTLAAAVACWGVAMAWSAAVGSFTQLLFARLSLGVVTAAAGPLIASLTGDYFPGRERGRIYGYILAGELLGAGFGFAVSGDLAAVTWRAAFVVLAVPAALLSWAVFRLPEPARGGQGALLPERPSAPGGDPDVAVPASAGGAAGRGVPAGEVGGAGEEMEGDRRAEPQTDAQRLAREHGLEPDPNLIPREDLRGLNLIAATRHVLRVRTNVLLIIASACGYYFMAGVETFGTEFVKGQYGVGQAMANLVLLCVGLGAIGGVLVGGRTGDILLRRGRLTGRITVSAVAASAAALLPVPALFARSLAALPFLMGTAFALAAQNPPLDAARLDILPSPLWGRAEAIRTLLRSLAQSAAPLLFGAVADNLFGGGHSGLQWTFVVMLAPLAASAVLLFRARRTYPPDVATAAASPREAEERPDAVSRRP